MWVGRCSACRSTSPPAPRSPKGRTEAGQPRVNRQGSGISENRVAGGRRVAAAAIAARPSLRTVELLPLLGVVFFRRGAGPLARPENWLGGTLRRTESE